MSKLDGIAAGGDDLPVSSIGPIALIGGNGQVILSTTIAQTCHSPNTEAAAEMVSVGSPENAASTVPRPGIQALAQTLAALQLAAGRFASTLNVMDCPVIHVKGETYVFSSYMVGPYQLAFYSVPELNMDSFDTTKLDESLEHKLGDLGLFLSGISLA